MSKGCTAKGCASQTKKIAVEFSKLMATRHIRDVPLHPIVFINICKDKNIYMHLNVMELKEI